MPVSRNMSTLSYPFLSCDFKDDRNRHPSHFCPLRA